MGLSFNFFRSHALFLISLRPYIAGGRSPYVPSLIQLKSALSEADHMYTSLNHQAEKRYHAIVWMVLRRIAFCVKVEYGDGVVRAPFAFSADAFRARRNLNHLDASKQPEARISKGL